MSDRPQQRPEGALIEAAQKRAGISQRKAADKAGMSEGHWRAIVNGYRTVSAGVYAESRAPAATLARMAHVVGISPEQLVSAGREDAAQELQTLIESSDADSGKSIDDLLGEAAELMDRIASRLPTDRNREQIEATKRLMMLIAQEQTERNGTS